MSLVLDFHTSTDQPGDVLVYHNQSECGYGQEIIRDGNYVAGRQLGDRLCDRCKDIAAAK